MLMNYADKAEPIVIEESVQAEEVAEPEAQTYEATFYTAYCEGCSGITAKGHDARKSIYTAEGYRVIAVDPSVISLNSVVDVTLEDGTTFRAQALDTGGAIKGERIDVLVASRDEAIRLGRQDVQIEVISEGDGN